MGRTGTRTLGVLTLAVGLVVALTVAMGAGAAEGGRTFEIALSGANEFDGNGDPSNPHGDADRGSVRLTINVGQRTVCWTFGALTLTAGEALPHMGHIHEAPAGVAGPVVLTLFGVPPNTNADNTPAAPTGYPTDTVCVTGVDRDLLVGIFQSPESYYVNLHNDEHPGGVVRGQLR